MVNDERDVQRSFQSADDVVEAAVQGAEIPGAVLHVRLGRSCRDEHLRDTDAF